MIDLVDSMDYYSLSKIPKSGYSHLKNKTIKPKYKQNPNTDFWKELLVALETFRTSHHSPCSTIKSSSKINTMSPWVHLRNGLSHTFPWDRDLKNLIPTTSLAYKTKICITYLLRSISLRRCSTSSRAKTPSRQQKRKP
jgi:hypothetical protein